MRSRKALPPPRSPNRTKQRNETCLRKTAQQHRHRAYTAHSDGGAPFSSAWACDSQEPMEQSTDSGLRIRIPTPLGTGQDMRQSTGSYNRSPCAVSSSRGAPADRCLTVSACACHGLQLIELLEVRMTEAAAHLSSPHRTTAASGKAFHELMSVGGKWLGSIGQGTGKGQGQSQQKASARKGQRRGRPAKTQHPCKRGCRKKESAPLARIYLHVGDQ